MNDKVQMIRINDVENNLSGLNATVSGWGQTESETSPNHLKKAHLQVSTYCKHGYCPEGIVNLWTTEAEQSICFGDSGGTVSSQLLHHIIFGLIGKNQSTRQVVYSISSIALTDILVSQVL